MDIQKVATQLINYLGENPELITQFIQHPYSTTAKATGTTDEISKKDMSQIVTAAAALSNNQKLGAGEIANIASALLGQNNNSVHSLTSMLFGGGNTAQATAAAQANTTQAGTLDLGSLVSMALLAGTLMNAMSNKPQAQQQQVQLPTSQPVQQVQPQAQQPAVNLADGLSIGEIASLAGQFLGGGAAAQAQPAQPVQQVQQQAAQQQAAAGLDFGTIAQLASLFLKQK